MSKLSKLLGKPKDFVIGGEVFSIYPLSVQDDLELVLEMSNPEKAPAAIKKLIVKTIKKSVPDATDEEIQGLGLKYFKDFKDAIEDVNGLGEEKNVNPEQDRKT